MNSGAVFHSGLFLIQIAVILFVSRVFAAAMGRIGQPRVIGEMLAGVALGPSCFGLIAPAAFNALLPPASLPFLDALSQPGLVIFVFIVGIRVDFAEIRRSSRTTVALGLISILAPMAAGIFIAQKLFPAYGSAGLLPFTLFIGTAMSVTAFPVLARILAEKNLIHTRLGSVAIAAAAINDMYAWIMLSAILAILDTGSNSRPIGTTLLLLGLYLVAVAAAGMLLRWGVARLHSRPSSLGTLVVLSSFALASAAAADWIGMHALFGAFVAGLATPRSFREQLIERLEPFTIVLLIPVFFALTGIRTTLVASAGPGQFGDLALILAVAISTKWGACCVGARLTGLGWRESSQLGLLMNTRGLVELVVLKVGLDRGIIQPSLYSMMVIMAVTTTIMTAPLIGRVESRATTECEKTAVFR